LGFDQARLSEEYFGRNFNVTISSVNANGLTQVWGFVFSGV